MLQKIPLLFWGCWMLTSSSPWAGCPHRTHRTLIMFWHKHNGVLTQAREDRVCRSTRHQPPMQGNALYSDTRSLQRSSSQMQLPQHSKKGRFKGCHSSSTQLAVNRDHSYTSLGGLQSCCDLGVEQSESGCSYGLSLFLSLVQQATRTTPSRSAQRLVAGAPQGTHVMPRARGIHVRASSSPHLHFNYGLDGCPWLFEQKKCMQTLRADVHSGDERGRFNSNKFTVAGYTWYVHIRGWKLKPWPLLQA